MAHDVSRPAESGAKISTASFPLLHRVRKKRRHVIFDYNSRLSWWIFISFLPLETGMNTAQLYVIYLLLDDVITVRHHTS